MAQQRSEDAGDGAARDGNDHRSSQRPTHMESVRTSPGGAYPHSMTVPLSTHWPRAAAAVRASLLRRGLDPDAVDDILQEAAVRAISHHIEFNSVWGLTRWVNTVAHNLASNWLRHERFWADEEPPDRPLPDVAETVEGVFLAEAVAAAIAELPERDRAAIRLADARTRGAGTKRERDLLSLRLHRARARLRPKLRGLLAAAPWVRWWRWRRLGVRCNLLAEAVGASMFVAVAGTLGSAVLPYRDQPTHVPAISRPRAAPPAAAPFVLTRPGAVRPSGDHRVAESAGSPSPVSSNAVSKPPIVVGTPATGTVADAGTSANTPERPMFCANDLPAAGSHCVGQLDLSPLGAAAPPPG